MKSKGKILLVDDNETFLEHCQFWFEENFEVQTAASGEDAMELVAGNQFDVLVVDYNLPGMNGLELIRRAKRFKGDIQSLIITDFPNLKSAKEGIDVGIKAYIEKEDFKCGSSGGRGTELIRKEASLDLKSLEDSVCRIIENSVRRKVVSVMNKTIRLWGRFIDPRNNYSKYVHKAEFAEKSGLWKVQVQNEIKRTRGLDRYLDIGKLPNNPNLSLVIRSVEFVLDQCRSERSELWDELKAQLLELETATWK